MKEMIAQRKAAKSAIKGRVPIIWVLLAFGIFLIFTILSIVSISTAYRFLLPTMLGLTGGTFLLYLLLAIKYKKWRTSEQEAKKSSVKHFIGSLVFMLIVLGAIIFGLSFFIWLIAEYPFSPAVNEEKGVLMGIIVIALVVFFASSPFIMALWYKTAPGVAVRFIIRVFKAFNWKMKDKACEIMVLHSVQDHSFFITFKRAFTALVYSMSLVFSTLRVIGMLLPEGFGRDLVDPPTTFTEAGFINYCSSLMVSVIFPLVLSFVLFFWALPSTYLLDDAGIVYYKKYLNRRQPAELRTVSQWFLGIVQPVLGTSGLISYSWYVFDNRHIVGLVYGSIASLSGYSQGFAIVCAIQFAIFMLGFPFVGTILMSYILQLFQESQYNKLKTHLFQELVNIKVDPRVVQLKFLRSDAFQDRTLLDYVGENFFHNPPLKDSVSKLPPAGDIPVKDMVRK